MRARRITGVLARAPGGGVVAGRPGGRSPGMAWSLALGPAMGLILFLSACGGQVRFFGSPGNCGHIDAEGFVLSVDGMPAVVGWHGTITGAIRVRRGETLQGVSVQFLAADSTLYEVAEACRENSLTFTVADPLMAAVTREPGVEWAFDVVGVQSGVTRLGLRAWHENHMHAAWDGIPIQVMEE